MSYIVFRFETFTRNEEGLKEDFGSGEIQSKEDTE